MHFYMPVRQRLDFKLEVLVHKSLQGLTPPYLSDDCQFVTEVGRRRYSYGSWTMAVIIGRTSRQPNTTTEDILVRLTLQHVVTFLLTLSVASSLTYLLTFVICDIIVETVSKAQTTNVYCYPVDIADQLKQSDCSSSQSSLALDSLVPDGSAITDDVACLQSAMADTDPVSCDDSDDDSAAMESFDDFEDFCIIDEPGLGIMVSFAPSSQSAARVV